MNWCFLLFGLLRLLLLLVEINRKGALSSSYYHVQMS